MHSMGRLRRQPVARGWTSLAAETERMRDGRPQCASMPLAPLAIQALVALAGLGCHHDRHDEADKLSVLRPPGYSIAVGDAIHDGMRLNTDTSVPAHTIAASIAQDTDHSGDLDLDVDSSQPCEFRGDKWFCHPPDSRAVVRFANGVLADVFATDDFAIEDCTSAACAESTTGRTGRYSSYRACDTDWRKYRLRHRQAGTTSFLSELTARAHIHTDPDWHVESLPNGTLRIRGTTSRLTSAVALCVSDASREASPVTARFTRSAATEVLARLEPVDANRCRQGGSAVFALARRWVSPELPPGVEFLFEDHLAIEAP